MADRMDLSDKTAISMPMRNLLSILAAVGIGVYAFFGIQERLNNVETRSTLMEADLTKNTEFRIKWPRGELRLIAGCRTTGFIDRIYGISGRGYAGRNGVNDE